MREDDRRAASAPPHRADVGVDHPRRGRHHAPRGGRAEAAPAPDADRLPGPVRLARSAHADRREHRRGAPDPPHGRRPRAGGPGQADHGHGRPPAIPRPALPARVQRRPAPADRDRPGPRPRARPRRLRRAGLGARRLDPGAGPEPPQEPPAGARPDLRLHRPQHGRRRAHQRPRRRDVPRPDRRGDRPDTDLRGARTPLHAGAPVGDPAPEPGDPPDAGHPRRRCSVAGQSRRRAATSTRAARCAPSSADPRSAPETVPPLVELRPGHFVACHFQRPGAPADSTSPQAEPAPAGA